MRLLASKSIGAHESSINGLSGYPRNAYIYVLLSQLLVEWLEMFNKKVKSGSARIWTSNRSKSTTDPAIMAAPNTWGEGANRNVLFALV